MRGWQRAVLTCVAVALIAPTCDETAIDPPEANVATVAAAGAGDTDADGAADGADNCVLEPNGPDTGPNDQVDTDGDRIGNACDGDLNQDSFVGGPDFTAFLGCFNADAVSDTCLAADMNGDGFVGGPDFTLFLKVFNSAPGPSGILDAPVFPGIVLAAPAAPDVLDLAWLPATDDTTAAPDMRYEVHLGGTPEFEPAPATLQQTVVGVEDMTVGGLTPGAIYYALVLAVDEDDRPSPERQYVEVVMPALPLMLNGVTPLEDAIALGLGEPMITGSTYTYAPAPGYTPPTVGAVLTGTIGMDGYLVRVDSVMSLGPDLVVETSPASLSEAVDQADFPSTLVLFDVSEAASAIQVSPGPAPAVQSAISTDPSGERVARLVWPRRLLVAEQIDHIGDRGALRFTPGPAPGTHRIQAAPQGEVQITDELTIDVDVNFQPTLQVDASWTGTTIHSGEIVALGALDADVTAIYRLTGAATIDHVEPFPMLTRTYFVVYGPVVLTLTFTLEAQVLINAMAAVEAEAGAHARATVEVGARFNAATGQWDPVFSHGSREWMTASLDVQGSVDGEIRLVPELDVAFYGALSGELTVEPYVDGQIAAQTTPVPRCPAELTAFDFGLGLQCFVGVDLDVLLATFPILPATQVCGPPNLPPPKFPLFDLPQVALSETGGAENMVELFASVTDGTNNPFDSSSIEWEVTPGTATLTPSAGNALTTLECMSTDTYTVTFSGHGSLGELGRRCAEIQLTCTGTSTAPDYVVAYGLDEGVGTTAGDASGNGYDGTLQNGAGYSADAKFGSHSVVLDGTDDRIDLPRQILEGAPDRTIQMWVKTTATSGFLFDYDTWGCCPRDFMSLNADGTVRGHHYLGTVGSDVVIDSVTLINDGGWHHVALSLSSTDGAKLFVNGVLEASDPTLPVVTPSRSGNHFVIGCETNGNIPHYTSCFAGKIDDFAVDDVAKTSFDLDQPI